MNINLCRDFLKNLPPSQIEIIPHDEKDLKIAKQTTALVNHYRNEKEVLKPTQSIFNQVEQVNGSWMLDWEDEGLKRE